MSWRLNITKDISSAEFKSLHATPTTDAASVGSGFHVSIYYNNGNISRVFYRPLPIDYSASVDSVEFEIFDPGAQHRALTRPPASLGSVYNDVVRAAIESFKEEAKKPNSQVTIERRAQSGFNINSDDDFPALGGKR